MLIATRNLKHNGVEYTADEEVSEAVFSPSERESLIEDGVLKHVKTKKDVAAEKADEAPSEPAASVTPAENPPAEPVAPEFTPKPDSKKQDLLDYAAAHGVTNVDPSMTRNEIYTAITGQPDNTPDETPALPADQPVEPVTPPADTTPTEPTA